MREAEEHRDHLAAEIGERARLAIVVGEVQLLAEPDTGDIGELEFRRRGPTAAAGTEHCRQDERQE
ncbi:hypothetical protein D3C83_57090 [compost metagenome]